MDEWTLEKRKDMRKRQEILRKKSVGRKLVNNTAMKWLFQGIFVEDSKLCLLLLQLQVQSQATSPPGPPGKWLRGQLWGSLEGSHPEPRSLTVPRLAFPPCPVGGRPLCILYDEEGEVWNSFSIKPSKPLRARPRVDTPSCFGFLVSTCSLRENFLFPKLPICGSPPQSNLQAQPPGALAVPHLLQALASPELLEDLVAALDTM